MQYVAVIGIAVSTILFIILLVRFLVAKARETEKMLSKGYSNELNPKLAESLCVAGTEELRFEKTLQWNVVYYSLLITGGLIAVGSTDMIRNNETARFIFIIIGWICALSGTYLVIEIQHNLRIDRIAMSKIDKIFRLSHYWMEKGKLEK
jgi:hypothetical protein